MYTNTTNHNPPYNFEYVFTVKKNKYVLTVQVLRDNKKVAYVTFGRMTAKRMRPFVVKASDYKLVFNNVFEILGDVLREARTVRAFYISFPSGYERIAKGFRMLLNRYMNRNPSLKLKLYMRSSEDRTDFLMVRKPFDDKAVLKGEGFEEATINTKPMKRVKPIKIEVEIAGSKVGDVEVDVVNDGVEEIVSKLETNPDEFENIPAEIKITEDEVVKMIRSDYKTISANIAVYKKFVENNKKFLDYCSKRHGTIMFFTGHGYNYLHNVLREGKSIDYLDQNTKIITTHYIKKVFEFFKGLPEIDDNIHVIRTIGGTGYDIINKIDVGGYFVDPSLTYTSTVPFELNVGVRFVVMNILLPKGTKCIPVNGLSKHPNENEITLPPGSVFKIIKKNEYSVDNRRCLYVDVVYVGNVADHVEKEASKILSDLTIPQLEVGNIIGGGVVYYVIGEDSYLIRTAFDNFVIAYPNAMQLDTIDISTKEKVPDVVKWVDLLMEVDGLEEGKVYSIGLTTMGTGFDIEVLEKIDKYKLKVKPLRGGGKMIIGREYVGVAELDKKQAYALYNKS